MEMFFSQMYQERIYSPPRRLQPIQFKTKTYPDGHLRILILTELQWILKFHCLLVFMLRLQPCGRIQQDHVKNCFMNVAGQNLLLTLVWVSHQESDPVLSNYGLNA